MEITIKNCNSIDEGTIFIKPDTLNIKFGINGTGKSTIAKALTLSCSSGSLSVLTPFKYHDKSEDEYKPSISGVESINSVSVFDENYINKFVFQQDEVVKNSFEIFIKNEDYEEKTAEFEKIVSSIRDTFKNNAELNTVITDLNELSGCFGKSKGSYSAVSSIGKGISKGNKIEHIPSGLEGYSDFLTSESNTQWIKWQVSGNDFMDLSTSCPYCMSPTEDKKETIKKVSEEYDSKAIEHLLKVVNILEKLGQYFSEESKEKLYEITKNKIGLTKEENAYLKSVKNNVDLLKEKFEDLKNITFNTFGDTSKVIDRLKLFKIDLSLIAIMNSQSTSQIVNTVNDSLDTVISQAGRLQGQVNQQNAAIQRTIQKHKTEINDFLKFAGYRYFVDIENNNNEYKMILKHYDSSENISNGGEHLSYGEKNAFSLILFMYETLSKKPDLIILDDPISSFDRNKKFAIIEMLFRRKECFKHKTVLMMTHDLEPIIDIVSTLSSSFRPQPHATFIRTRGGLTSEIEITKSDILTFTQICKNNISNEINIVNKLVYLRRYYEIIDDRGIEYQLISNLLHKRDIPNYKEGDVIRSMTQSEIDESTATIKGWLHDFDYSNILNTLKNKQLMIAIYKEAVIDYEKLQLFRIINPEVDNDVIRKYINETFHIENEYIMQLNPSKYEVLPEFVVQECDRTIL